jgi:hypothetical protein
LLSLAPLAIGSLNLLLAVFFHLLWRRRFIFATAPGAPGQRE